MQNRVTMDEFDIGELDAIDFDDLTYSSTTSGSDSVYHTVTSSPRKANSPIVAKTARRGRQRVLTDAERAERKRERNRIDRETNRQKNQGAQDEILFLKQQIQNYKDKTELILFHLSEAVRNGEILTQERIEEIYANNDLSQFMNIILD